MPTSYDEEERIYHKGFRDGWMAAHSDESQSTYRVKKVLQEKRLPSPKPKRKASAYSKRYGAAFRKLSPKYKLKNGSWGKDGFKRCQKAAHTLARKD